MNDRRVNKEVKCERKTGRWGSNWKIKLHGKERRV